MKSIAWASAALSVFATSALADEMLKYRTVYYITSAQSQNIPDTDGRIVAVVHASGVASFPDGSVAVDNLTATLDYTKGSRPAVSYNDITFSDGSALLLKCVGATTAEGPRSTFKNTVTIIGGKGRFVGAKGDRTSAGERLALQPVAGAQLYADVTLNIKK